mmetsp:Transcript_17399/g.24391  ORF Transcript_17399/g.24391 Transcript_17399/m.24391 type:complete len:103 (-) Transcript_17399:63-371(-)
MMNGFLTEKKLTILLAEQIFPKLVKKVGKSQLQNVLEIMAPKWMICMFVDSVPLDANCMVFQSFFHRKGHLGTAAAIFTLISNCEFASAADVGFCVRLLVQM